METSEECEDMDVLEAEAIYVMMKKDYRISRSVRAQWFLEHLNTTITIPRRNSVDNCQGELTVVSVIPNHPPSDWKVESSHLYKYLVTSHSSVIFLTHKYRIVYCLDMSPSLSAVDIQHGEIMIDEMFVSLKRSLNGLTMPFLIPGSTILFQPQIFVTVIAHTPFFTTPAQQVLVQGWQVTPQNLEEFLMNIRMQLEQLENAVAEVAGIAHEQLEAVRAESEKLVGGLFEESPEVLPPPLAHIPMVSPDLGFINMLRYGMLALRLLPESSCASLIVLTDGIIAIPDVHIFDSVLTQLRSNTVACSFLHVGSLFHPHCCKGLVPYADLMQFIATATFGAYMTTIPEITSISKDQMNMYHRAFLTWNFHKSSSELELDYRFPHRDGEWHVSNQYFYGNQEPQLLRKKQIEDNLNTSLTSVLCCRLKEGYTIKNVNLNENHIEVCLVLPWKNHVYIEYLVTSQWPPTGGNSSPGPGTGMVHYSICIEAPYEFLHDITCLLKKPFKSPFRQAVVTRFWATLKNLSQSDQMLVHLNSFPGNPTSYTVPESIRSGMPVFYLHTNSAPPVLSTSDLTSPQFASFWRTVCSLDTGVWQKWLHTHRIGLILQHDHPLPRYLHLPNTNGRFQVVQCRQAAAALYSLLKDWSTFVLIENQTYVKFISGDNEKPPSSFYIIRVSSKPPCVVINIAFLGGTPSSLRHQVVQQLRERIANLKFPQRPSNKESLPRKVSVVKQPTSFTLPANNHSPVLRTWSDINCCILLRKPVEKILIRYERMPSDFGTVVFPDGTQPIRPSKHPTTGTNSGGGLVTTLSRYLHHKRWIWAAQDGPNSSLGLSALARILSTITKMRLQEGFNFAHSTAGIITMVLEVQMKGCADAVYEEDGEDEEFLENGIHPCVIQYVLFPPHTTSTSGKESGSDDDGTDDQDVTNEDVETDGELQIITECWIEPQHGLVVNSPPERSYMENLPYQKLADVICRMDAECISSLLTFEHLSLMCRDNKVPSPIRISDAVPCPESCPHAEPPMDSSGDSLSPYSSSPHGMATTDQRIQYIPFAFDIMKILPKCQQAEQLYSTYIQDLGVNPPVVVENSCPPLTPFDVPNRLLSDMLFDHLKKLHNKELHLSIEDSLHFLQLLGHQERETASPIPNHFVQEAKATRGHNVHLEAEHHPLVLPAVPKWRCFLKGISVTHIMLTFVPASFAELKLLMLTRETLSGQNPCAVKMLPLNPSSWPPPEMDEDNNSCNQIAEQGSSVENEKLHPGGISGDNSACVTPASSVNVPCLSRSSSCDTAQIINQPGLSSQLHSTAASPLPVPQREFLFDIPFRVRASSWGTVTKRPVLCDMSGQSLDRIRAGSMDSKTKIKRPLISSFLLLRDSKSDIMLTAKNKREDELRKSSCKSSPRKSGSAKSSPSKLSSDKPSSGQLESSSSSPGNAKTSQQAGYIPNRGSITFPIYVYDCPLSMLMEALIYRDLGMRVCKDLYEDRRYKHDNVVLGEQKFKKDFEQKPNMKRFNEPEQEALLASKHMSPEPKSDDSDTTEQKVSLEQHCKILSLAYCKCFVFTLFKSLHLIYDMHAVDVQAAVDECEENLIDINVTEYLKTVCGHLKDFCIKVKVDELKQQSLANSPTPGMNTSCNVVPVNNTSAVTTSSTSDTSATTATMATPLNEVPAGSEENNKQLGEPVADPDHQTESSDKELAVIFPLSLLQLHAPCHDLKQLHQLIKDKFLGILLTSFKPVPSHPQFLFCAPYWDKIQAGDGITPPDGARSKSKLTETEDDGEKMTYHSGLVEFNSEVDSATAPDLREGTRTRTSMMSNMDSDSFSEMQEDDLTEDISPLFLHLTCTLRCREVIRSCPVRVLPTCLGEIVQEMEYPEPELDLHCLCATLDILCLTLPPDVGSVTAEKSALNLRKGSFDSASPGMQEEEPPLAMSASSSMISVPRYVEQNGSIDRLKHLPDYQHKAVTTCVAEIQWLMRDEIAAFLLDVFPLQEETLDLVAEHVASSQGRPSCLLEKVPLQFVFGPEQSLERFLQEFRNLSVSGYHIMQEGQMYYLIKDKQGSSRKKNSSLIPPLGIKSVYRPHMDDNTELWNDFLRLPVPISSDDNGAVQSNTNTTMETCASEEDPRPMYLAPLTKRHRLQGVLEVSGKVPVDSDSDEETPSHLKRRKEKRSSVSKDKVEQWTCSESTNVQEPAPITASPSLSIGLGSNDSQQRIRPDDGSCPPLKRSQSCSVTSGKKEEALEREPSPTRWGAVLAWQRRQQGTPGHRSEVSSLVESGHGTEDGYEGDSSDSADECDWLHDLETRRPSLPNFWLIMRVDKDAVTTYFHCRFMEMEASEVHVYREVQRCVISSIKSLCKVVNQTMLLQNLHDTRMCDQLLEPESSEDIWKHGSDSSLQRNHSFSHMKSLDDGTDVEYQGTYLEATMKFMPGWFSCSVVWETHFCLHPRLKTGTGKPSFSRGIKALRTVLLRFSVNNRKNMFVYRDNSGNVFYLRLHENVRWPSKLTPSGGTSGPVRSDPEDNSPGPVSRSSSVASLTASARKQTGTSNDESQIEERPRMRSFGEKDLPTPSPGEAITPCVTPQPPLSRPEDTIVLKVHGISEAGPEVKEELVQVLQNRLDDAVLEILSIMLGRNPMCKLAPDDVHFIQKPNRSPESVIQFSIPPHALAHLQALAYYLRQNLLEFLHIPRYTDQRPEFHFQDYSQPETSLKRVTESDLFLYNQTPTSGSRGIACIALAVVDSPGNLVQHSHYPKPFHQAYKELIKKEDYVTLTSTAVNDTNGTNKGPGPAALVEFRIWKQGRVNIESLSVKLHSAVRHGMWDLVTEFYVLTAPLTESPCQCSEPSTPHRARRTTADGGGDGVGGDNNVEALTSPSELALPPLCTLQVCKTLDDTTSEVTEKCETGERGRLHEKYQNTMQSWLDFAVDLSVPAVKKHTVNLATRHSLAVMVKEIQNLVTTNAPDTSAVVFYGLKIPGSNEFTYVPNYIPSSPNGSSAHSEEGSSCLVIGRNITQWKACVTDDGVFDLDALFPKVQKSFQKFPPQMAPHTSGSGDIHFVPRQCFLLAVLSNQQILIYTYNWSKEKVERLNKQATHLGYWLSARSSLLTSILTQKMGLFHNLEVGRKSQESNPYMTHLSDLDELIKFPALSALGKETPNRRSNSGMGSLNSIIHDVFRDSKPSRPIHGSHSSQDPVVVNAQQMLDTRQMDRRESQKKLCAMWHTRVATPNIPMAEDIISLFKQHSRLIHYCLTPLLFLPRWRIQSAATRDHLLSVASQADASPQGEGRPKLPQITRYTSSGSSLKSLESPTSAGILANSGVKSRRNSDDKWHSALSINFIHEYKQYLQTLGFIPIQIEVPSSPKRSSKVGYSKVKEGDEPHKKSQGKERSESNICYLQKSILGGILVFEIAMCEPFFLAKLHALECSRLQSKTSSGLVSQFTLSFLDECDKIKILMHLHSFTYDFHLRTISSYVSGSQATLKQGYHLINFLDDFLKYYSKAPNFARNLVHADNLIVSNITTPARQLFNYLLSHEKMYNMEVFRMVPVTQETDSSLDNEYVLVQLESTPHVTYKDAHDMNHTDDFNVTLIVSHDTMSYDHKENSLEQSVLHLKYYLILTSRRELFPKLEIGSKLGKFRTVSTASHDSLQWCQPHSPTRSREDSSSSVVNSDSGTVTDVDTVKRKDTNTSLHQLTQIRQESVNYLGYYSSHEQLMQELILERASLAQQRIRDMVAQGMVHCRTHLLWNKLQCIPRETTERRKDEALLRDLSLATGLTYNEFCELRGLAVVEPLSQLDPRLGPLLCQSLAWYQALAKVLMSKYSEHYRLFVSPDGSVQHVVILHPRYLEAFMMLSIDTNTSRGDLCAVYRKTLQDPKNAMGQLEFSLVDIQSLVEGFVSACCFHLWVGLL